MSKIIALNVPQIMDSKLYEDLLTKVSKEEKAKIEKFAHKEDSYRSLLGNILTRAVICVYLGISNEKIQFAKNQFGKPYLLNSNGFYFNISHSGEWVLLIFGNKPVGIDIEKIRGFNIETAKGCLSQQEFLRLQQVSQEEQLDYFFDLWTLKESYIKAIGTGLYLPLDSFSILCSESIIAVEPNKERLFFKQYSLGNQYKVAACSYDRNFPQRVNVAQMNKLLEELR
ncbi:4'-phosphopantetheinyl transferase family protein [Paenibacillus motobuensis]|uniref:4'-phosphopantetheinyl transferase superfamily protein n=1 Tax=Paenibacillus motobuensis TaxID=295324 RepID=A0ABN0XXC7_9BACL